MSFNPTHVNAGPWLTLVLLLPIAGAVVLQPLSRRASLAIKTITVMVTVAVAVLVAAMLINYDTGLRADPGRLAFQYEQSHSWISAIGASYHLGIDGLSAWLLALNAGLFLLGALVISRRDTERLKLFCGLLLFTESATTGVLISVDVLLFYVFWEAMLIPLYLLLSSYGDPLKRGPATLKFIVYTAAGSLLMLLSIIYLWVQTDPTLRSNSFDLNAMLGAAAHANTPLSLSLGGHVVSGLSGAQFAFLGFALAFAIKVPLVPFHTWLPNMYEAAPAATLVFFAGIVSKLGAFGFLRYNVTLFPQAAHDFQFIISGLAVLTILYGALMALSETDIKRIVAYSSVSHLGFIVLGIFALNENGINGSILQMVNHGIVIAALFLVVGYIEQRTGTRDLAQLTGLERRMPILYALFLVITLGGLGLPGMGTFVGEFTIMLGAFAANPALAVLAGVGVVLASWYMLRLHQGLMHERPQPLTERVRDLRVGEALALAPLVALMVGLGVFPRPVGDLTRSTVHSYVSASQASSPGTASTAESCDRVQAGDRSGCPVP